MEKYIHTYAFVHVFQICQWRRVYDVVVEGVRIINIYYYNVFIYTEKKNLIHITSY